VHCTQNSFGSLFNEAMPPFETDKVFYKGQGKPDYSGFQGRNSMGQSLDEYLKSQGVSEVDVCGIAGDYCVLQTAQDAVNKGYETNILTSLTASVGGETATFQAADKIQEMQA
jgi:nicotinamidase/pyrazinamidase